MKTHDQLVDDAKTAIQAVFGDTTVSQDRTLADLRGIIGDIELLTDAIECDLRNNDQSPN